MLGSISVIYYNLIKAGLRTIDDIPPQHKADVERMLEENSKKA